MTIRVLVADDQELVRSGLRLLIDSEPDLEVVGAAADGAEAIALAAALHPDVALVDIRMPGVDGLEATRQITAGGDGTSATRVLVLTTFDLDEYVFSALRGGASGFLLKDAPTAELLHAIRVIAAGDALLAPSVTRQLIKEFSRQPASRHAYGPGLDSLTDREKEVLALVARGLSNREIAAQLFISVATTKTHIGRLLTKLDSRDRAQLVVLAFESGFVTLD
jgi:DNA-binding NarL/FixJ family response regulator